MILIFEKVMSNGLQAVHLNAAIGAVEWILDYPESDHMKEWKERIYKYYIVKEVIYNY
jgi:hypothetical protein